MSTLGPLLLQASQNAQHFFLTYAGGIPTCTSHPYYTVTNINSYIASWKQLLCLPLRIHRRCLTWKNALLSEAEKSLSMSLTTLVQVTVGSADVVCSLPNENVLQLCVSTVHQMYELHIMISLIWKKISTSNRSLWCLCLMSHWLLLKIANKTFMNLSVTFQHVREKFPHSWTWSPLIFNKSHLQHYHRDSWQTSELCVFL